MFTLDTSGKVFATSKMLLLGLLTVLLVATITTSITNDRSKKYVPVKHSSTECPPLALCLSNMSIAQCNKWRYHDTNDAREWACNRGPYDRHSWHNSRCEHLDWCMENGYVRGYFLRVPDDCDWRFEGDGLLSYRPRIGMMCNAIRW